MNWGIRRKLFVLPIAATAVLAAAFALLTLSDAHVAAGALLAVVALLTIGMSVSTWREIRAQQERLTQMNRELELQIHSKSQTEDALRQSKEFLQMAQSAGGIGIFELDLHTGLMRGSERLFQLLGLPQGNGLITQEQWFASVYPQDLEALIAQFAQAVSGAAQFHIEYRVLRPDESVIWISATGRVFLDGFGAARRVVGTVADVHARKIVEEELRRTAQSLAIAQKAGGIATFDVNLLSGNTVQSDNMREIVGLAATEPLPNRPLWLELVHPEDRPQADKPLSVCGADGSAYQREYRIIRADGSVRWLSERGVAVQTAAGETARITGAVIDVTERKSSETAMLELEERLERAVRGTSDALWEWDAASDEVWLAPRFRELLGYADQDPLPATAAEFGGYLHPDDAPRINDSVREHLENGAPYDIEARIRRKDGAYDWVRIRGAAERDANGSGRRMSGSMQVITERKRTELALIDATNAAASANRAKSAFLANMSHEIRTPMNGVIGMTRLLADTTLTAAQREYVEVIRSSGESLLALINNVLDVSKIEAGRVELEALDIDLGALVAESVATLGAVAATRRLGLKASVRPEVPSVVRGDPLRLRQVLINLIGNALKFTARGEVDVDVGLEAIEDGRALVRFSVRDTGIGIAPDRLDRLFKSFSQVDSSTTRHYGGSGLGLSIVKQLAELMGGTVGVESEVGRGSVFWFTARFERAAADRAAPPPAPAAGAGSAAPSFAGAHVLLVEDNTVNQKVARKYLEKLGVTSDLACNGCEAVEAWERSGHDLILMDCQMPVMDGFEATREIRRRERGGRRVPIIALTANALASDRKTCLDAGMDEHLPKPLELESLASCLGRRFAGRSFGGAAPAPSAAPVDLEALGELVGDDAAFQRELVETFIASGDATLAHIVDALAAGDFAALRKSAHSLKGASANIRAGDLSLAARQLESRAASEDANACREQLESLRAQFERTRDYLRASTCGR